jgi:acetate kinase
MKILVVNAGSSSLKFQLFEMPEEKVIISGYIEKVGIE